MSSVRRVRSEIPEAQSRASLSLSVPCPECRGAILRANVAAPGVTQVCPLCAAVFIVDEKYGPRMLRTQEWYDLLCKPGHDHIWLDRERAIEKLTRPPRGLMVTTATPQEETNGEAR